MSEEKQYYFNFSFFKVDPKWRWMADLAKEESAKEVENVLSNTDVKYRTYSTLGLRNDADFLFWFAGESVEEIQDIISKLYLTILPFLQLIFRIFYLESLFSMSFLII